MEKQVEILKPKEMAIFLIIILIGISFFAYLDFTNLTIPYDDIYSLFMAKNSFKDIVSITAKDVHPPLYYWGLKIFSSIFSESLFALRLFSLIPIACTFILSLFSIRKLFGKKTALLFIILIILFPVSQFLATEIRMYSWTMFFVLLSAIYAYKAFISNRLKNWIIFLISSICSAYMHNYGLLSIVGIYTALILGLILTKKRYKNALICLILFSLAYIPWLIQLIDQFSLVSHNYWIKPLTLNDLYLHIYYFYSPKEVWLPFQDYTKTQMMAGLILLMGIQVLLMLKSINTSPTGKTAKQAYISIALFLFPIIVGAIISIIHTPILVTRYMTCSFGLYVLGLSLLLSSIDKKKYKILLITFFALLAFDAAMRFYSNTNYYKQEQIAQKEIQAFVEQSDESKQTLIANDFSYHVVPRLQVILPYHTFYILSLDSLNMAPFRIEKKRRKDLNLENFIMIHQERNAIQKEFRKFYTELSKSYTTLDSLHASDIILYKMRRKQLQ